MIHHAHPHSCVGGAFPVSHRRLGQPEATQADAGALMSCNWPPRLVYLTASAIKTL